MLNNIKDKLANGKTQIISLSALVGAAVSSTASAALPPEAEAAKEALTTAATDYVSMAWTIVPIVVVGFIGIKLFRKSAQKAT
ncbi:major coat protein [Vibrio nigripulchritudo]|uniref:major coat protein n=1 Tax=Vibrio nigripulchritudo TaxID=28173 RepID=UPI0005FA6E0E|nr:major coat protein [Vibrio nigripulchritudo]KJY76354.1 major coat protein [Vibrio nigripulchritudo]